MGVSADITKELLEGFPAIADANARVLILGSMPGEASLEAAQYYAHPRNAFWWIMGELFGAGLDVAYPERGRILKRNGVAVWDVLKHCHREGSLDTAIEANSCVHNDFESFFQMHQKIHVVFFNGGEAEKQFRRHVLPGLVDAPSNPLRYHRLPSTSPANARLTREQKLEAWRIVNRIK